MTPLFHQSALAQTGPQPQCLFDENTSTACNVAAYSNVTLRMAPPASFSTCSEGTRFPVFFQRSSGNQPTNIFFKSLRVRFKITGDAYFDPVYFQQANSTIYNLNNVGTGHTPGATIFAAQGKTLDWVIFCSPFGSHRLSIGSLAAQSTIFNAGIVTDAGISGSPSDNIQVSIESFEITGLTTSSNTAACTPTDPCCSFPFASPMSFVLPSVSMCSPTNITGSIVQTSPSSDEEAKTYTITLNNSGPALNIAEIDFRIRFTDVNENMPQVVVSTIPYSANLPLQKEEIDDENGNQPGETGTYYYRFGAGTLANGITELADITAFDPLGFENLQGKGTIVVEYVRIKLQGSSSCCRLMGSTSQNVQFAGVLPCASNVPTIRLEPYTGSGNTPCPGYILQFNNIGTTPLVLTELSLEVEVEVWGQMAFNSVSASGSMAGCINAVSGSCPTGCVEACGTQRVKINFVGNASNTLTINNFDFINVIFNGVYGGINDIEVVSLQIKQLGQADACIPNFVEDAALQYPINKCDACTSSTAYITTYAGTIPLNTSCEKGLSLWMNFGSQPVDQVNFSFSLQQMGNPASPVNISTAKTVAFCDQLSNNTCPPCKTIINGNTVTVNYCGPPLTGNQRLLDLVMTGTDVVNGVNFGSMNVRPVNGSICNPRYLGSSGVFPLVPTGPTCQTWNTFGSITFYKPNGTTVGSTFTDVTITKSSNILATTTTSPDCNGTYQASFDGATNTPVAITPFKDCASKNGVTTFDVARIASYVLNGTPLSTGVLQPYSIIAADANRSGSVTTVDVTEVQKLVLGIYNEFPNNTSWRFVPKSHAFSNPANPFSGGFPEAATVNFPPPSAGVDFVAIKTGDINGSAICVTTGCSSPFSPEDSPTDRAKSATLKTNSLSLKRDEEGWVEFGLHFDEAELFAWQAGLDIDPTILEILDYEALADMKGASMEDNFGTTEIGDGRLRTIWYPLDGKPQRFKGDARLFRVKVRAKQLLDDVSSAIRLSDEVLLNTAYLEDGTSYRLALEKPIAPSVQPDGHDVPLVQVVPNPFLEEVVFRTKLGEGEHCQLTIHDQFGRVVEVWEGAPSEGQIVFKQTSKWGKGVFNYLLKTSSQTHTGSVVKL
jgi:hypothetical protein